MKRLGKEFERTKNGTVLKEGENQTRDPRQ
jgi:hypothetical protein